MIESITIKRFQKHSKLKVEFDKVTTIVGRSGAGKSSVLRALQWVCMNQPAGDSFVKDGEGKTTVDAVIDGKTVTRIRGKGENGYALGQKEFEAFGNSVPESIAKLINVCDINFQWQYDMPYWFTLTAGEVGRRLNAIVNLEQIDRSLTYIASQARDTQQRATLTEERLEKAKQEREAGRFVLPINTDLKQLETLESSLSSNAVECSTITKTLAGVQTYTLQAELLTERVLDGEKLITLGQSILSADKQGQRLSSLLDSVYTYTRILQISLPDLTGIDGLVDEYKDTTRNTSRLSALLDDIGEAIQNVTTKTKVLTTVIERMKKEVGGVCPLCGSPMKS